MSSVTQRESLLDKLVAFAGDPAIVEEALAALSTGAQPPKLKDILVKILEIRAERGLGVPTPFETQEAVLG